MGVAQVAVTSVIVVNPAGRSGWMDRMIPARGFPDRSFPDSVPLLVDATAGVALRAHRESDLQGIVEQCRDPESIRWTTVPTPYDEADARTFLDRIREAWDTGGTRHWAVDLLGADGAPSGVFGGSIAVSGHGVRGEGGDGIGEVAFGLHPAARGRRAMSAALRLVRDYAFDVLDLRVLRWRAAVGNWGSRWTAAAAGFRFDGTVRSLLVHRGELLDGWLATMTAEDPRVDLSWPWPPRLAEEHVRLRPFSDGDVGRIVEACSDPATQHWLVSLPRPYGPADAAAYVESVRESAARRTGWAWCIADAEDDLCLGAVSLEDFGGYARRLEIGYWAHPDARGRGAVSAAVRMITAYVDAARLADSVIIRCAAGNAASRRVAERCGYTQNGIQPASEPLGDGTLDDLISYTRP